MPEEEKKEEEKVENQEAPPEEEKKEEVTQEESPPMEKKPEEEVFDAKASYAQLSEALELQAGKIAAIEEALDKALEEEEQETAEMGEEPPAEEKKEEEVAAQEDEKKEEEQKAQMSKDHVLKLEGRLKAIEAKLGFKRTVSSSKKKADPISEEAEANLRKMGII